MCANTFRGDGEQDSDVTCSTAHLSRGVSVTETSGGRARKMPRGPGNMRQKLIPSHVRSNVLGN